MNIKTILLSAVWSFGLIGNMKVQATITIKKESTYKCTIDLCVNRCCRRKSIETVELDEFLKEYTIENNQVYILEFFIANNGLELEYPTEKRFDYIFTIKRDGIYLQQHEKNNKALLYPDRIKKIFVIE